MKNKMFKAVLPIQWLCLIAMLMHSEFASAQHVRLWGTTYEGGQGAGVLFRYSYVNDSLEVMYSFEPWGPRRPNSGVIYDSAAQKFYGTYSSGGLNIVSSGGVYSYKVPDSAFSVIYDCRVSAGGTNPVGAPIQAGSKQLWGTDMYGGSNSYGTLYTIDLDSNKKTIRRNFSASNSAGYDAYQSPVFANGKLYGLTHGSTSSAAGMGVLYEFDTSTNVYTVKKQFTNATGNQPQGRLLLHPNGKLYGATTAYGANNHGTFFEYDPVTDVLTVLHHFDRINTGSGCYGLLTLHPNGRIYGLASFGGVNGKGTIFEFDTATKAVTKKLDLVDSIGAYPMGGLTLASNGRMYTATNQGGANGLGSIMEYDLVSNIISRKISFNDTNGTGPTWEFLQEAWTNDRPVLAAFTMQDSLCLGDTAHKLSLYARDADGDTLQAIVQTTNPAIMPLSSVQVKFLGAGNYEVAYTPGSLPTDTGKVSIVVKLGDDYGAVAVDSVVIDLYVRDCRPVTGVPSTVFANSGLVIRPNPADDIVHLTLANDRSGVRRLTVLNTLGQKMQLPFLNSGSGLSLDVSELSSGLYHLLLETNSGELFRGSFWRR